MLHKFISYFNQYSGILKWVNAITSVTNYVLSWKSKGLSAETMKPSITSDNSPTPLINCYYTTQIRVKFAGSCLK